MSPRISVLTLKGSDHGLRLLNLLQKQGVAVDQVVVLDALWRTRARFLRRCIRQLGPVDALAFAAWGFSSRVIRNARLAREATIELDYRRLAGHVDFAEFPRSTETVAALRAAEPDLLLLASSGIVPRSVLAVPRLATLNAHPGLLPDYRGQDPEFWAVTEGRFDAVGSTLHVVDAGIDTGPILTTALYEWRGDETLELLSSRLLQTCLELLVQACLEPWPETLERALPQGPGRYFHQMSLRRRWQAGRRMRAGVG